MEDLLTFAIGDVHGCFDKLEAILLACDRVRAGREVRYVFIGDYIDRGPDARKVIDLLMDEQLSEGSRFVCLRGNHEQMLILAAAEGRSDRDLMTWWANGGEQTLDSYGVNDPSSLPAPHLEWIKAGFLLDFRIKSGYLSTREFGLASPSPTNPRTISFGFASHFCHPKPGTASLSCMAIRRPSRGFPIYVLCK
jgi:hypothetical protein